jgi:hypothetical protein
MAKTQIEAITTHKLLTCSPLLKASTPIEVAPAITIAPQPSAARTLFIVEPDIASFLRFLCAL